MKHISLVKAYQLDGKGGGQKLSWDDINKPYTSGIRWLHLDYSTRKTKEWIKKESQVGEIISDLLLDSDTRPRSLLHNSGIFLSLRGVNLNPGQDPEDMVSIRIWAEKNLIITTRRRKILAIDDICEAIDNGKGPKNRQEFILIINEFLLRNIDRVVDNIENNMDDLEERIISAKELGNMIASVSDLRREAILIKRYLLPQREALHNLQIAPETLIGKDFRMELGEIRNKLIIFIENLEAVRDRLSIIHEEVASNISMDINNKMYVLAIISIIFLPLAFLTGLLGINVGGIPLAEDKFGFLFACGLLVVVAGITLGVLKVKKWL